MHKIGKNLKNLHVSTIPPSFYLHFTISHAFSEPEKTGRSPGAKPAQHRRLAAGETSGSPAGLSWKKHLYINFWLVENKTLIRLVWVIFFFTEILFHIFSPIFFLIFFSSHLDPLIIQQGQTSVLQFIIVDLL